jgi:hypothetical protein
LALDCVEDVDDEVDDDDIVLPAALVVDVAGFGDDECPKRFRSLKNKVSKKF